MSRIMLAVVLGMAWGLAAGCGSSSGGSESGRGGGSGADAGTGGTSATGGTAGLGGSSASGGLGGDAGSGACGSENEPCCAGSCNDVGTTCVAGICVPCGNEGQSCCGASCNAGDNVCSAGTCVHCGTRNEPCCGLACQAHLTCNGDACVCGGEGQPCCGGDTCDTDLRCAAIGLCTCEATCNADNTAVLDCHGQVVQPCQGLAECIAGECVDPCADAATRKTSYGCDFWALKTEIIAEGSGACFAVFVANTWHTPVHINVEYQGQTLTLDGFARIPQGQGASLTYAPYDSVSGLPAGEVAILFLARGDGFLPACPTAPAVGDTAVYGTGRGAAFHITTDKPVGMYQILPYGGGSVAATSATLLLPVNVWDTDYLVVDAYQKSVAVASANPFIDILAKEDATTVTLQPRVSIVGGSNVSGGPANTPIAYTLNRGEYLQISQPEEVTGSTFTSTKPVALWGGASYLNVPVSAYGCDSAQQQIPPIKALGNRYVGVRYRGRNGGVDEAPPWRIVGAVDGTMLTWTPSAPVGAPAQVNAGQIAEFNATGPFLVESQDLDHPFYAAAYMTGGSAFGGEGDPEWVNLIPPDQFLRSYVLFTDPTYSETNLVVVRVPDQNDQFADVTLDCAGPLTGWQQIGKYQWTRVDLVTGNFQNVGSCSNGRHEMSSAQPFGVTVWGWGSPGTSVFTQYVSYAYPAGAAVARINDVGR